jgi:hypothetical protein
MTPRYHDTKRMTPRYHNTEMITPRYHDTKRITPRYHDTKVSILHVHRSLLNLLMSQYVALRSVEYRVVALLRALRPCLPVVVTDVSQDAVDTKVWPGMEQPLAEGTVV